MDHECQKCYYENINWVTQFLYCAFELIIIGNSNGNTNVALLRLTST